MVGRHPVTIILIAWFGVLMAGGWGDDYAQEPGDPAGYYVTNWECQRIRESRRITNSILCPTQPHESEVTGLPEPWPGEVKAPVSVPDATPERFR